MTIVLIKGRVEGDSANVISQYDYTYDAAGRRTEIARSGSAMSESRTDAYGYNARNELISASRQGGASPEYAYQYDDIGNRIMSTDLGTNRTYTANSLNQYTLVGRAVPDAPQGEVEEFLPQFDEDGNQTLIQTSTGIWQVQYNGENRPTRWERISPNSNTQNSNTQTLITMSFDRMGRRVQYLETCGSLTNSNKAFTYDGYLQIANFEHQTSNFKLQTFIWDPTEPVATRPLVWNFSTFQPFNTSTSYYTHDMRPRRRRRVARRSVATEPRSGRKRPRNKNVSDVVAFDGLLAAHYEYAPFGEVVDNADSSTWICTIGQMNCNPFCFSSEYNDAILDLVYYNYRHYEPVIGRWLNFDPIGLDNNSYCFAYNSPGIDVLGLLKFDSSCDSKLTRMIESSVYSIINNLLEVRIRNGVASAKIANILKSQKVKVPFDWHVIGMVNDTIDEDKVYNMIDRVYYEILRGKTEIICCLDTRKSSPCKNPLNATASAAHEKGKIYLCKGVLRSPETYGGYACIIVHELIHKFWMTIRQTDDDGTRLQKERATVLISELLTGKKCPAPGYFK